MSNEIPVHHWLMTPEYNETRAGPLPELHCRWAAAIDHKNEVTVLYGGLGVCFDKAGRPNCPQNPEHRRFAEKVTALGGVAALEAEIDAAEIEVTRIGDQIKGHAPKSFYDLAALFDIALEHSPDSPLQSLEIGDHYHWDLHFLDVFAALAPGFVFTYFSRNKLGGPLAANGIPIERDGGAAREQRERAAGDRLLCECEAVAAAYRAPVLEGDAGLIAAIERYHHLMERENQIIYPVAAEIEEEVVERIIAPARDWLWSFISNAVPQSLTAARMKLRYLLDEGSECEAAAEELLAMIEEQQEA